MTSPASIEILCHIEITYTVQPNQITVLKRHPASAFPPFSNPLTSLHFPLLFPRYFSLFYAHPRRAPSFASCSVACSNHSKQYRLLRFRPSSLAVVKSPFLCARMSSKFNVRVTGCSGSVVFGDNASIHVGSPATDGECGKYASHRD